VTGNCAKCAAQHYYQISGQLRTGGERAAVWGEGLGNGDSLRSWNKQRTVEGLRVGETIFVNVFVSYERVV
jgi:hypothetical protein